MRLINLRDIDVGMRLGEPLRGAAGQLLLQRGVRLSSHYIALLHQKGFPAVYIQDDDTSDIQIPHPVAPETRAKALAGLVHAFDKIAQNGTAFRDLSLRQARQHQCLERFAAPLGTVARDAGITELIHDVDELIDQALHQEVLAGLNSIKTHDSYTFQHSIDVTIMALVLAKKAGWDKQRLKTFGIGCILHDIRKIFIDKSILNKPGPLTKEEFDLMKTHPGVGREVIHAIAPDLGYLVPQVAYQHHEREDGSGYPGGRRGSGLSTDPRVGAIHEFGSMSAVADVYDALTSCRCYRPGWSPERAANFIVTGAGTQFNRQVVELFTSAVAPFPVCSDVHVCNGRYAGFVGIVSAVSKNDLKRPRVRLLFDPFGKRIDAVEIDLTIQRDISIAAVSASHTREVTQISA